MVILILNLKNLGIYSPYLNTYIKENLVFKFIWQSWEHTALPLFTWMLSACLPPAVRWPQGPATATSLKPTLPQVLEERGVHSLSPLLTLMDMWDQSFEKYLVLITGASMPGIQNTPIRAVLFTLPVWFG